MLEAISHILLHQPLSYFHQLPTKNGVPFLMEYARKVTSEKLIIMIIIVILMRVKGMYQNFRKKNKNYCQSQYG